MLRRNGNLVHKNAQKEEKKKSAFSIPKIVIATKRVIKEQDYFDG